MWVLMFSDLKKMCNDNGEHVENCHCKPDDLLTAIIKLIDSMIDNTDGDDSDEVDNKIQDLKKILSRKDLVQSHELKELLKSREVIKHCCKKAKTNDSNKQLLLENDQSVLKLRIVAELLENRVIEYDVEPIEDADQLLQPEHKSVDMLTVDEEKDICEIIKKSLIQAHKEGQASQDLWKDKVKEIFTNHPRIRQIMGEHATEKKDNQVKGQTKGEVQSKKVMLKGQGLKHKVTSLENFLN